MIISASRFYFYRLVIALWCNCHYKRQNSKISVAWGIRRNFWCSVGDVLRWKLGSKRTLTFNGTKCFLSSLNIFILSVSCLNEEEDIDAKGEKEEANLICKVDSGNEVCSVIITVVVVPLVLVTAWVGVETNRIAFGVCAHESWKAKLRNDNSKKSCVDPAPDPRTVGQWHESSAALFFSSVLFEHLATAEEKSEIGSSVECSSVPE